MSSQVDLAERAATLAAADTPFVWATVVRAERPTSAKAGDSALVHPDGRVDGFVGGECAEATVRAQSLDVLATGRARLLRITPHPDAAEQAGDDVVTVHNTCLSGGTLDIFLEPSRPLPLVGVFGHAPIATALLRADRMFGQRVRPVGAAGALDGLRALVVASHGDSEVPLLEAALRGAVPYVGLVASRRRGAAVVAALDVPDTDRARVHTPAGLDLGARTPPEVALSILAEIVAELREPAAAAPVATAPATAVDPVCGMSVAAVPASPFLDRPGGRVYFCGPGCREAYRDNPAAYARAP